MRPLGGRAEIVFTFAKFLDRREVDENAQKLRSFTPGRTELAEISRDNLGGGVAREGDDGWRQPDSTSGGVLHRT